MTKAARQRNRGMIIGGALMTVFGTIFMFQGLGTIKSASPMTNSNFWAVAGPVIAFFGILLLIRGLWGDRKPPSA